MLPGDRSRNPRVASAWMLVAKLDRPRRLQAEWRALNDLRAAGFDRHSDVRVPNPFGLSEATGELFMERVEGDTVRHLLRESPDLELVRESARALARLHATDVQPLGRFSVKPFVQHARFHSMIEEAGEAREEVERIVEALITLEDAYQIEALVPVHGDFHFAQLMKSKDALYILDFAMLAPGDPALDVGHLLAHVTDDNIGGDVAAIRAAFVEAYLAGRPEVESRLPLYEAFAHLRRAPGLSGARRAAHVAAAIAVARL